MLTSVKHGIYPLYHPYGDGVLPARMYWLKQIPASAQETPDLRAFYPGDVLATVCGNQANVALMQHRHDEAQAQHVVLNDHGPPTLRGRP